MKSFSYLFYGSDTSKTETTDTHKPTTDTPNEPSADVPGIIPPPASDHSTKLSLADIALQINNQNGSAAIASDMPAQPSPPNLFQAKPKTKKSSWSCGCDCCAEGGCCETVNESCTSWFLSCRGKQ